MIVTWQAGGGVNPVIGLGRLLAARGHQVLMLAPRMYQQRIERAGCAWRPIPAAAEFDPSAGRAADEQREYMRETFLGAMLPDALAAEVAVGEPDVLVIDALLASTVCAALALSPPVAALVHTTRRFHGDPAIWGDWGFDRINQMRAEQGRPPLPSDRDSLFVELQRCCRLELVVMPAAFDERTQAQPNVVHVGPIFEEEASPDDWDLPWPPERILEALADLPVHVLATTGLELDPAEVRAPPGIEMRRYIPHVTVLPNAAVVVTHAGTGTLMAAFAHGVPVVCVPLGRDQPANAARAAELGVAVALPGDARPDQIAAAVTEALSSQAMRSAVAELAADIAGYGNGARAVEALESLLAATTPG
jgi:UDP:flavonoid glycosyltransferase YjiC (YdhE family)